MSSLAVNLIIFGYLLYLVIIVKSIIRNKESNTAEKYALGTRKYGTIAIFMTVVATMIGPGYSIGVGGQAYSYGLFYTVFYILAMLQLFIFGIFFVKRLELLPYLSKCRTAGDIVKQQYGNKSAIIIGFITFLQAMVISGVVSLGGAKILNALWGVSINTGIILFIFLVSVYATIGGLPAVIKTDKIQLVFIVLAGLIAFSCAIYSLRNVEIAKTWFWKPPLEVMSLAQIVTLGLAFFLGEAFLPVYLVRGFMAKTTKIASRGFIFASIFGMAWFVMLSVIGVSTNIYNVANTGISIVDIVNYSIGNIVIGQILLGIVFVGLIGIVMSTMDSILNVGAISFIRDVIGSFIKIDDEKEFRYVKPMLIMIAAGGYIFTTLSDNLVEILLIAYYLWVPTVVVPLAACIIFPSMKWEGSRIFIVPVLIGSVSFFIARIASIPYIPDVVFGFIMNLIAFTILYWIKKK